MEKNKNTYESNNETLEEFKNSFFYGSRNNLFFKYLGGKNISENEFTIFIEKLLNVIVDDIDKDEFSEMKKLIIPKSKVIYQIQKMINIHIKTLHGLNSVNH